MAHKPTDSGRDWESLSPAIAPLPEGTETDPVQAREENPPGVSGGKSQLSREAVVPRRFGRRKSSRRSHLLALHSTVVAASVPLLTLMLAIRLVATTGFLWLAYHRPGFPQDSYGFTTADRMTYGSYGVNYIVNLAPENFLSSLRTESGEVFFRTDEVQHMTDVKRVLALATLFVLILLLLAFFSGWRLRRSAPGRVRTSFFAGGLSTLGIMLVLGVLAAISWESFFTGFHRVFFPQGNWTFSLSDTLIRLYPPQFWVDAAVSVAVLVILITVLLLILSRPMRKNHYDC